MNRNREMGYIRSVCLVLIILLLSGCQKTQVSDPGAMDLPPVQSTLSDQAESGEEESSSEPEPVLVPEKVEVQQQVAAEYELWLASAMVFGLSMEYPDFQLNGIYAASSTAIENKNDSLGVCILFQSAGTQLAVESKPLSTERTQAGSRDLSTALLGYASFDEIDPASITFSEMKELAMDDLEQTMSQSLLVSLYYH